MSRRSRGLVATWAEIQRQQQRQEEAQRRAWAQHQREQERQQRAAERAAARSRREQQAAYRERREADARHRTDKLDRQVRVLRDLLVTGCAAPAFTPETLKRSERVEPFSPGQLGVPVPMPDPAAYQPRQGGWGFGGSWQAQEQARARYESDWHAAQAAEAQRQRQLAAYRQQYQRWADERLAEIRGHNAGVEELVAGLRRGEPTAVVEYFTAALYASRGWPDDFPRQVSASFDPASRLLVLNWELPGTAVVPEVSAVRYMPGADRDKEVRRPVTERRALYRDVLAQCMLLAVRELFAADRFGVLEAVALNGFVDDTDPATGHRTQTFLATVMVSRADFDRLNLTQVTAPDCLVDGLRGQLSDRPDRRAGVRPARLPGDAGRAVVTHGDDDEPDLCAMDPVEFEDLVAELFRAMGMQAVTTSRSGDGGVDVDALDPDPIRGGKIVVQVKRYRNTVPPSAVRDLYGTVQSVGANKGVLITTSAFGPGSHAFAGGKPLTLVQGTELVDLLHRHGLNGRLGGGPGSEPDTASGAQPDGGPGDELDGTTVLGLTWSGGAALDVCALVCRGQRVLGEEWFVFYNNPAAPDSSVRMMPGHGEDRAAVWVRFGELPPPADRLVLVAAVDPEADPGADLSCFTRARIRLSEPAGTAADELAVSDGRPGETALVLGSFRRRANGDWEFVLGGKGYEEGLVQLVEEYGIEVG
ncbi:restriction endonuclease [Streptomyces sp. TRM 70361]|uniref:restriction endonuclease n=1 Tax=Streptomyces sp. TRM 70361 TaxID=3116553 RepID=UPI002E7C181E|nr:restriction endonuclease [Streptomyces sp. TRM 70361]MEE1939796.1 restriction endonuclease [Streptomyces sp. TRM 70361]